MVWEMTKVLRLDVVSISNTSTAGVGRRNYAVKRSLAEIFIRQSKLNAIDAWTSQEIEAFSPLSHMNFFDHFDVQKAKVDPQGTDTIFSDLSFLILYILHKLNIAIS